MKAELLLALQKGDFDQIIALARRNKRTLSLLTAQTYHPDELTAWRAVEGIGLAARQIAGRDPEYVRVHLRRLFWLVSDESGGIGWHAAEAIGEILYRCPGQFDEFISPLFHFLDMEPEDAARFRIGTLWAIGRVGSLHPHAARPVLPWVLDCLADGNPQARGMGLWCLNQIGYAGPLPGEAELLADASLVTLYQAGELAQKTVGALAASLAAHRWDDLG